jgi:hypothetical protein
MTKVTLPIASRFDASELRRISDTSVMRAGELARRKLEQFGSLPLDRNNTAYGFPMRGLEQTHEQLAQIVRVADNAQKAWRYCTEIGITPLAIVPTSAWKKMCNQADLFTVCPSKDSMIAVSLKGLTDRVSKALSVPAPDPSFWLTFQKFFSRPNPQKERMDKILRQLDEERSIVRKYFEKENWNTTVRELLPENSEPSANGHRTKIFFPAPPTDVGLVIQRLTDRVTVSVTLESRAIYFPDLETKLLNAIESRRNEERKQYEAHVEFLAQQKALEIELRNVVNASLEPIVTFNVGEVTVIAAQYGEWVIEQCVVERCIEESLLVPTI